MEDRYLYEQLAFYEWVYNLNHALQKEAWSIEDDFDIYHPTHSPPPGLWVEHKKWGRRPSESAIVD